jgi:hypothetical protein
MRVLRNIKAVSTLVIIILMIISAIIGGVISYLFTVASYIEIPTGTTVTITGVYLNEKNATAFKVGVLNPSYSPADATITKIAVSLKTEPQLYEVLEAEPSIENGTIIPKGKSLNITCSKLRTGDINMTWGEYAAKFAGESIIVHVFSSEASAANMEVTLPLVKLHITDTDFDSTVTFRRFNVTAMNDANSVINLTINEIMVPGVELTGISPELPLSIENGTTVHFVFNGSWYGLKSTTLGFSTKEGYRFSEEVDLPEVYATIQNVTINEDSTDHFNVTVSNLAESANYVNVTKITCTLENGTSIEKNYDPPIGILPNSTCTLMFNESWREYRGKAISVKAFLLQDFETESFEALTPQPIIVKVLNEKEVFKLIDDEHFNITLQNHQSSLKAVTITKIHILIEPDGHEEEINVTDPQLPYGPMEPGTAMPFYCNITKWTRYVLEHPANLTLTAYVNTSDALEEYAFQFTFPLPRAELNITDVICTWVGETKYLNVSVENQYYSQINLTISKVTITLQNQLEPLEQIFPQNQTILQPYDKAVLLCLFDWEKHPGETITITVSTSEGMEASQQFQIPVP